MIVLTGTEGVENLRGRVSELAIRRAYEVGKGGVSVLVLEKGDDVHRDFLLTGRYGLLTYLDDHYQAPFEYVHYVMEDGRRVYEALLLPSRKYLLVAPDEVWVDERLRIVLEVEGEEVWPSGDGNDQNAPTGSCPVSREVPEGDRTGTEFTNRLLSGVKLED